MTDATENVEGTEPEAGQEDVKDTTDWKAEARKWESRAKENSLAAAQLKEYEDASKSEAQRLSERADAAERELESVRLDQVRSQVALEKGLTVGQARRLVGTNRDEFLADADELLADMGRQPSKPRPDPSQGARHEAARTPEDEFGDFIRRARGA